MDNKSITNEIIAEFKNRVASDYSPEFIDGFLFVLGNEQNEKEETVVTNILTYIGDCINEDCINKNS